MTMLSAIKSFFGALVGGGNAQGGSVLSQIVSVASEKVTDVDKLVALLGELAKEQIRADANPGWVGAVTGLKEAPLNVQRAVAAYIWGDTLHKLGRQALWWGVLAVYVLVSIQTGQPLDLEKLAMLAAGPAIYTVMKGAGRSK